MFLKVKKQKRNKTIEVCKGNWELVPGYFWKRSVLNQSMKPSHKASHAGKGALQSGEVTGPQDMHFPFLAG